MKSNKLLFQFKNKVLKELFIFILNNHCLFFIINKILSFIFYYRELFVLKSLIRLQSKLS